MWLLLLIMLAAPDENAIPVVGGQFAHIVQSGDSLTSIGARYGVEVAYLASINDLKRDTKLKIGQKVMIDNRHIVPQGFVNGIVINIPQRMLFHFSRGSLKGAYPVGLGMPTWPTVIGEFKIVMKEKHPTWDVPLSIQAEMRAQGKPVVTSVPPSPNNPLGDYYLTLSTPGFGIHGTNAPASIYLFQSHGCIRLHPDNIAELFSRVEVGYPVFLIYEPLLVGVQDNVVFIESHRDVYRKGIDYGAELQTKIEATGIHVDLKKAIETSDKREGIAQPVY